MAQDNQYWSGTINIGLGQLVTWPVLRPVLRSADKHFCF
jgi:hypothetical protein